jgi:toxin ParE1/3/4
MTSFACRTESDPIDFRDFPELGYMYRKEIDGDIRILLYGHFRIAYLIKSQERIDILGVFHGALDIERFLL